MFMGAITKPSPEHNANGKVFLERISKKKRVTQKSHHQHFADDVNVNNKLRTGKWCLLYADEQTTFSELKELIADTYDLEEFEADRLTFSYETFTETDKMKKFVCLDGNDVIEGKRIKPKGNQERDLSLDDVKLSVEM